MTWHQRPRLIQNITHNKDEGSVELLKELQNTMPNNKDEESVELLKKLQNAMPHHGNLSDDVKLLLSSDTALSADIFMSCFLFQLSLVLLSESIFLTLQSNITCTWWSHVLKNLSLHMITFPQLSLVLLSESISLSLQSHHCTWWNYVLKNLSLHTTTFAKYSHSRLQLERRFWMKSLSQLSPALLIINLVHEKNQFYLLFNRQCFWFFNLVIQCISKNFDNNSSSLVNLNFDAI